MPELSGRIIKISGAAGFIQSTNSDLSYNHALLLNRNAPDQHSIGSITNLQDTLNNKASVAQITTLQNDLNEKANVGELDQFKEETEENLARKGERLFFDADTSLLYLADAEGNPLDDGVIVATSGGGGGGGGSISSYVPDLKAIGERTFATTAGSEVSLSFIYSSEDANGQDDGNGIGTISFGSTVVKSFSVIQGTNTIEISDLLSNGTNNLRLKVENSEGVTKVLTYTITIVSLSITTTFAEIAYYSGDVAFSYTLSGSGNKTVHYILDGTELGTEIVSSTGRSRSYYIPAQSHGGHTFEVYATASVNGIDVESNHIVRSMVWVNSNSATPIVASSYSVDEIVQGSSVIIPYLVYDPLYEEATVTLSVIDENGDVYSTKQTTRGREKTTEDPWSLQDYPAGETTFRITCREVSLDIVIDVEAYEFPLEEITDGLVLSFSADGRTNGEANPASWTYGEGAEAISATFTGFGWNNADGWLQDDDNASVLRFLPGDSMVIPFKPFSTDKRDTGYTIEVEFATRDVRDYESVVMSCLKGGRGFKIASQEASLYSEQSSISMLFKEDSRLKVSFVIEEQNLNRLIYIYINGIHCGVVQYPTNDNFQQTSPYESITIGSDTCGLDLYKIRCYTKGLNRSEQLDNFIFDRSTLSQRQNALLRNNILDDNTDEISMSKLPSDLPYMLISCPELPQYKGDKKTGVGITFYDPTNSQKSFSGTNLEMDVQGTSSAVYPVKNFKIKLKGGITINGQTVKVYELRDGDLPVGTFCLKTDYASCEGANNVELVELYEEICREQGYLTPPQEDSTQIRQGIAGRPIVVFWRNTADNTTTFVGKLYCSR